MKKWTIIILICVCVIGIYFITDSYTEMELVPEDFDDVSDARIGSLYQ